MFCFYFLELGRLMPYYYNNQFVSYSQDFFTPL